MRVEAVMAQGRVFDFAGNTAGALAAETAVRNAFAP